MGNRGYLYCSGRGRDRGGSGRGRSGGGSGWRVRLRDDGDVECLLDYLSDLLYGLLWSAYVRGLHDLSDLVLRPMASSERDDEIDFTSEVNSGCWVGGTSSFP